MGKRGDGGLLRCMRGSGDIGRPGLMIAAGVARDGLQPRIEATLAERDEAEPGPARRPA